MSTNDKGLHFFLWTSLMDVPYIVKIWCAESKNNNENATQNYTFMGRVIMPQNNTNLLWWVGLENTANRSLPDRDPGLCAWPNYRNKKKKLKTKIISKVAHCRGDWFVLLEKFTGPLSSKSFRLLMPCSPLPLSVSDPRLSYSSDSDFWVLDFRPWLRLPVPTFCCELALDRT